MRLHASHDGIRVLHSMPAPDGSGTKFADHMHDGAAVGVRPAFFSWRKALSTKYDVFHLHWPEYLTRGRTPVRRLAKRALFLALLVKLRVTRTPLVWTVHNAYAHENGGKGEAWLFARVRGATSIAVVMNSTTPLPSGTTSVLIPHGHYRDRFAGLDQPASVSGRLLYFGIIRPYKNVPALLEVFRTIPEPNLTMAVVGKPLTTALENEVRSTAETDPRVRLDLRFVEDHDLVREVSEAELVVLPYTEMNNSGALLVALSLDRPVLAPASAVNKELQAEVGDQWLMLYEGSLTADIVSESLAHARTGAHGAPDLQGRDWTRVGEAYKAAYIDAMALAGRRTSR